MPAIRTRAHNLGLASVIALLGGAFASNTHAGPSPLTLDFTVDGVGFAPIIDLGVPNAFVGDNRIEYVGSFATADFILQWQFFGDVNPGEAFGSFQGVSLSGDITLTNLTGLSHNYELNASVALNAALQNAMFGGSYSASLLSSSEGGIASPALRPDLVLAALTGQSMYSAGINGGTVQQDFADPFSASVGWGSSDVIPTTNYGGVPGAPNLPAPGVITSLSHALAFSLTGSTPAAGSPMDYDSVTFSMKIVVVPAPAALALLGVAGLVGRRRRRSE
jgi:hypothetical protein